MKRFTWISIPVMMLFALAAPLLTPGALAKGKATPAVVIPAADLAWAPMPNMPTVQAAPLWGVMTKGAHGAFVKLPANDAHPLHTHTNAIKIVVLAGAFKYQPEGGDEVVLGAGSYLMIPAGARHTSGASDEGCTVFQESTGAFDLKLAAAGK